MIDVARCLERLGLAGEDWGPTIATVAELRTGWRGKVPVPTDQEFADAQAVIDAVGVKVPFGAVTLADLLVAKGVLTQVDVDALK